MLSALHCLFAAAAWMLVGTVMAAEPAPAPKPATPEAQEKKEAGGVTMNFPDTPIDDIIVVYEDLTGLKVISETAIQSDLVSVVTSGEVSKAEAIQFIEKSLLLNGYSFVPAGKGMVKLIATSPRKDVKKSTRLRLIPAPIVPSPAQQ